MNEVVQQRPPGRIPRRGRDGARPRNGGFSVVEVLFTITLIALAIVPLMQATISSIRVSTNAGVIAEVDSALQDAADRVTRAPTLCNYDDWVKAALLSRGWPPENVTATYQRYQPGETALATTPGVWIDGACEGELRPAGLIQKVEITVTSKSGLVQRSIKVVKSDV